MIRTGLTSITFRKLSVDAVVDLAGRAGLDGIEWGGDIHVPHGDLDRARVVRQRTSDAGLTVSSYGSYYRPGARQAENPDPVEVLDTARELGAPLLRVWAGDTPSAKADEATRAAVIDATAHLARQAHAQAVRVAFEYHRNTLTDADDSTARLLEGLARDGVGTYWQPRPDWSEDERLASLGHVRDRLEALHVFYWRPLADGGLDRRPLVEGRDAWRDYFRLADETGRDLWALLEFVADDSPEQFLDDARLLRELADEINEKPSGSDPG